MGVRPGGHGSIAARPNPFGFVVRREATGAITEILDAPRQHRPRTGFHRFFGDCLRNLIARHIHLDYNAMIDMVEASDRCRLADGCWPLRDAYDALDCSYVPEIPARLVDEGALSDAQLETLVYAGDAFESDLPGRYGIADGGQAYLTGYLLGDGTSAGKGRQVTAIPTIIGELAFERSRGKRNE